MNNGLLYYIYYFDKRIYKDYLQNISIIKNFLFSMDFIVRGYNNNYIVFGSKQYRPNIVLGFRLRKKFITLKLRNINIVYLPNNNIYYDQVDYTKIIGKEIKTSPLRMMELGCYPLIIEELLFPSY